MLTREQAIIIINEYVKKDEVTINYSFPYHVIPKDIKTNFYYPSLIGIGEENFLNSIKGIIYKYIPHAIVLKQTINEIVFTEKKINFSLLVEDIKNNQIKFDSINEDELITEKSIAIWDRIRYSEILLIEKAEIILNIKEDIDSEIILFSKGMADKNKW